MSGQIHSAAKRAANERRADRQGIRAGVVAAIVMLCVFSSGLVVAAPQPTTTETLAPETPREFFNAGTRKLNESKLREAEAYLLTALAAQDDKVQPPSLFNLGHTRFRQGLEELKKGPSAADATARARAAQQASDEAIRQSDEALAGTEVQRLVNAYLNGRGVRRGLSAATKAVRRALQAYGATLSKWERASGDFKSALELNPADEAARQNAETVDRAIAKLVDSIRELEQAAAAMQQKKDELGQKMKELKGRIPEEDMPPGAPGDEEEEEDEPMGQKPDDKEAPGKQGEELVLPPELAGWLLDSFRLDKERRLPMGQDDTAEPKTRMRKPW